MDQVLSNCKITKNLGEATAGTTTLTGSIVDMANFDDLVLMAVIGTKNTGNYMYIEHGDESDLSDAANVADSKVTAAVNGEIVALEIVKPLKRYIRPYIVRGASSAVGTLMALQRSCRGQPVDNNVSGTIVSETLISPISGTI